MDLEIKRFEYDSTSCGDKFTATIITYEPGDGQSIKYHSSFKATVENPEGKTVVFDQSTLQQSPYGYWLEASEAISFGIDAGRKCSLSVMLTSTKNPQCSHKLQIINGKTTNLPIIASVTKLGSYYNYAELYDENATWELRVFDLYQELDFEIRNFNVFIKVGESLVQFLKKTNSTKSNVTM